MPTDRLAIKLDPSADPYYTDVGKSAVFQRGGGQSTADGGACRVLQTPDLRLLKTLETATVASTPLAIW